MSLRQSERTKSVSKPLSTSLLLAASSLIVLLSVSCGARRKVTETTRTEVKTWRDTSTLIQLRRTELVQLETLRIHFADTVKMVTRSVTLRERHADTTAAASTALRSDTAAGTTQVTTITPLTVESKKKGPAWLCHTWLIVVLIIFGIFVGWLLRVKKN